MNRLIALFLTTAAGFAADKKTALDRYVAKPDSAYHYKLAQTHSLKSATAFVIDMVSQFYC